MLEITIKYSNNIEGITVTQQGVADLFPGMNAAQVAEAVQQHLKATIRQQSASGPAIAAVEQWMQQNVQESS